MTMPSTSPIAQPVRQWTVALKASALSEGWRVRHAAIIPRAYLQPVAG